MAPCTSAAPDLEERLRVSVLCDRNARPGHDECRGGRDVERAHSVAARAHDVHGIGRSVYRRTSCAHHGCSGSVFGDSFATRSQCHQEAAHLCGRGRSIEQDVERLFGLRTAQRPFRSCVDQGFHRIAHAGSGTDLEEVLQHGMPMLGTD